MKGKDKAQSLVDDFTSFLASVPEDRVRVTRHDGVAYAVEVLEGIEDVNVPDGGGE